MYADRKGWDLTKLTVDLHFGRETDGKAHIDRVLHLTGSLDDTQPNRIAEIAERTPVTLTLKQGLAINTSLATDSPAPLA